MNGCCQKRKRIINFSNFKTSLLFIERIVYAELVEVSLQTKYAGQFLKKKLSEPGVLNKLLKKQKN